ncbi:hypothetical protein [uncultured Microbulbifer sp.]|uniref:hypothetical protein n=1 Tax=uncultured Microbulbifer sp. TaxID=348147 RepID=UPI00262464F5|nr:hypothetical protein [uncultured Microbulbifer sp.]
MSSTAVQVRLHPVQARELRKAAADNYRSVSAEVRARLQLDSEKARRKAANK